MQVALALTFKASKKEPLAELLERVNAAFRTAAVETPVVRFLLADAATPPNIRGLTPPGRVSAVDRVLKRWPTWSGFFSNASSPSGSPIRQPSNYRQDAAQAPLAQLLEIARGVPKSFPFRIARVVFDAPEFGREYVAADVDNAVGTARAWTGLMVTDSWWVNGRERSLIGQAIVEIERGLTSRPLLPDRVNTIAAALGKFKTEQVILPAPRAATTAPPVEGTSTISVRTQLVEAQLTPVVRAAIAEVIERHRAGFGSMVARAHLPHELASCAVTIKEREGPDEPTGPKKPMLQKAFKPLGYDVNGGVGTFTLRRRTPRNLTVEIYLDVGSWSSALTGGYRVIGLGFRASLPLVVSPHDTSLHGFPILGAQHWREMVENLAALVSEIDRTFPAEIEAAALLPRHENKIGEGQA